MKVEATWRGPGRLELLIVGVAPDDANRLLDSLGAADTEQEPDATIELSGWAIGAPAGQFFKAVYHWFHQGWSHYRMTLTTDLHFDSPGHDHPEGMSRKTDHLTRILDHASI